MKTLRQRLALTHTLVALLAVVVIGLLAGVPIIRAYTILESQNASFFLSAYYEQQEGWDDIGEYLEDQPALKGRRLVLADADRRVLFDTTHQLDGTMLPLDIQLRSVRVLVHNRTVGHVTLLVDETNEALQGRLLGRSITFIVFIGSLVASSVAVLVALVISKRLTQPLLSLTARVQRLASGERHEPIEEPAERELADLSRAFNTMAAQLAHQEDLRRQLMADIAHELRTPLSVLRLQLEGLEDGIEAPTPHVFASLTHEVGLLTRLVEDLRLLSLTDAGQLHLELEALDPVRLIQRVASVVTPRAHQHGIVLRVEPATGIAMVWADAQRLQQVLLNLVENALRYTPSGGHVTLRVGADNQYPAVSEAARDRALVGDNEQSASSSSPSAPADDPAAVVFEVEDTGVGIAPEDIAHIFDRFYRADRTRRRETGGSGLGLAIVQRLVEAQGGTVGVTSTLGKGTTFRVVVPPRSPIG